jgi:hypothetical protein
MALLTDRFALRRFQGGRVNNRYILTVDGNRSSNVEFTWAMAALAPDGVASEDGWLIPVECTACSFYLIGVAEQTACLHRSVEVVIQVLIAWGQTPPASLGKPCDRRFNKEAVALDQVAQAPSARTYNELYLSLVPDNDLARCISPNLNVYNPPVLPLD